jgi:hypothetical protein
MESMEQIFRIWRVFPWPSQSDPLAAARPNADLSLHLLRVRVETKYGYIWFPKHPKTIDHLIDHLIYHLIDHLIYHLIYHLIFTHIVSEKDACKMCDCTISLCNSLLPVSSVSFPGDLESWTEEQLLVPHPGHPQFFTRSSQPLRMLKANVVPKFASKLCPRLDPTAQMWPRVVESDGAWWSNGAT